MKIIKVVINNPLDIAGIYPELGDCRIIKNSLYIATKLTVKEVKKKIQSITNIGFSVYKLVNYPPEILSWIEEMQVNNIENQLLKELLKTVKK